MDRPTDHDTIWPIPMASPISLVACKAAKSVPMEIVLQIFREMIPSEAELEVMVAKSSSQEVDKRCLFLHPPCVNHHGLCRLNKLLAINKSITKIIFPVLVERIPWRFNLVHDFKSAGLSWDQCIPKVYQKVGKLYFKVPWNYEPHRMMGILVGALAGFDNLTTVVIDVEHICLRQTISYFALGFLSGDLKDSVQSFLSMVPNVEVVVKGLTDRGGTTQFPDFSMRIKDNKFVMKQLDFAR